jgi:hypothetical protein
VWHLPLAGSLKKNFNYWRNDAIDDKDKYQISTSMKDGILEIVITGKVTGHNVSAFQAIYTPLEQ